MTVYVITKAQPFGEEIYVGITATKKMAEKILRKEYPHMKLCGEVDRGFSYAADSSNSLLLFIRAEIV